ETVLNELYDVWWPNAPHRTLRNKTFFEWEAAGRPPSGRRPGEGTSIGKKRMGSGEVVEWPRYAIGTAPPDFDGDIEYAPLWAGGGGTGAGGGAEGPGPAVEAPDGGGAGYAGGGPRGDRSRLGRGPPDHRGTVRRHRGGGRRSGDVRLYVEAPC